MWGITALRFGLRDLAVILSELGAGSVATGIGFSWRKFWAYASDWGGVLPRLPPEVAAVVSTDGADWGSVPYFFAAGS